MAAFVVRRLLLALPVLVLVALTIFVVVRILPGDPAAMIAGPEATAEQLDVIREELGLNDPIPAQLVRFVTDLAQADFGKSMVLKRPVIEVVLERLPLTFSLAIYSLVLAMILGVISGVVAAVRHNTWVDQTIMFVALIGVSMPNFWLGLLFVILFGVWLPIFPVAGLVPISESIPGFVASLTLPALTLALLQMGLMARMTRSTMLEVLKQDYVRTALAAGIPRRRVIMRYALKNVLIPISTVIGYSFSVMLSGSVVVETVFGLPGLGRLMASSIFSRDYPVIEAGLIITALMFVLINLAVDIFYGWVDPRIHHG